MRGGSMDSEVWAPCWGPAPAQLSYGCESPRLISQPFPLATLTTTIELPIPTFPHAWGTVIRQWWLCKGGEDLFWGSRSDLSVSALVLCVRLPQKSPRMGWHFSASCLHCSPDSRRSIFKQKCRLHCNHPMLRKQTFAQDLGFLSLKLSAKHKLWLFLFSPIDFLTAVLWYIKWRNVCHR